MATYRVTDELWLKKQVALSKGVLLMYSDPDTEYTAAELCGLLEQHKLIYTTEQAVLIRDALVAEGVLEEVA